MFSLFIYPGLVPLASSDSELLSKERVLLTFGILPGMWDQPITRPVPTQGNATQKTLDLNSFP
jgi:hypothetical protein